MLNENAEKMKKNGEINKWKILDSKNIKTIWYKYKIREKNVQKETTKTLSIISANLPTLIALSHQSYLLASHLLELPQFSIIHFSTIFRVYLCIWTLTHYFYSLFLHLTELPLFFILLTHFPTLSFQICAIFMFYTYFPPATCYFCSVPFQVIELSLLSQHITYIPF